MILVALVLGAAYLASRPGSDIPAANGQGSAPRFAAIERFVRGEMAAQRIPGLALGISENDRITYLRGFGKADDSGRPVTPKTPFIIGSLSKSFTALAIMQLVEAGKVELVVTGGRGGGWAAQGAWSECRAQRSQTQGALLGMWDTWVLRGTSSGVRPMGSSSGEGLDGYRMVRPAGAFEGGCYPRRLPHLHAEDMSITVE